MENVFRFHEFIKIQLNTIYDLTTIRKINKNMIEKISGFPLRNLIKIFLESNNVIIENLKDFMFNSIGAVINKRISSNKPLIISGSPRSGTTWLAELLCYGTGGIIYWEPLHLRNQPELKKLNLTWRPVIKEKTNKARKNLFRDIVECNRRNKHLFSKIRNINQIFRSKFWVIKFVRANGVLNWMVNNFDIRTPLIIIRHPCAVISSQIYRRKKHGTSSEEEVLVELKHTIPSHAKEFLEYYPQYKNILSKVKSWEEYLAVRWSMDNYHLFTNNEKNIIILPYENLYLNGRKVLEKIFNYYNLNFNSMVLNNIHKPSSTVTEGSGVNKGNPLTKWKNKLNRTQWEKILEITRSFGLDFYTEEWEPNYDYINKYSALEL